MKSFVRTLATLISAHPFVSVKVKLYVSLAAPLLAGVTPPTPGPLGEEPCRLQVPNACHPEFPVPVSRAAKYTMWLRANPVLKVIFNAKVSSWPEPVAVDFTPLMLH